MSLKVIAAVFITSIGVASCGGGSSASADQQSATVAAQSSFAAESQLSASAAQVVAPKSLVNKNLLPKTIDPAATQAFETHIAINPSPAVAARGLLFVFLAGTGGHPTDYQLILNSGAAKGLHTLGLNYAGEDAIGVACSDAAAVDKCFWNARREVITGVRTSAQVNVGVHDAIVPRLTKTLAYLQANFPKQGWGQYLLADGTVNWSKINVGGHSQGGGHAGAMAKLYAMNRTCYFDSPADWDTASNGPASWEAYPNLTPATQQIGFTHTSDLVVPYAYLTLIWNAMGMAKFGPAVSVDTVAAPFNQSHVLTTSAASPNGKTAATVHSTTVADFATPVVNGTPLFGAVWTYACFQ
ncbi:MAG: BPSS1187 family protein [Janthinobacterium lividum]